MENPFQIGDVVETIDGDGVCPPGLTGVVAVSDSDSCYIDFGEEYTFTHDYMGLGGGKKYYWVWNGFLRHSEPEIDIPAISDTDFDFLLAGGGSP